MVRRTGANWAFRAGGTGSYRMLRRAARLRFPIGARRARPMLCVGLRKNARLRVMVPVVLQLLRRRERRYHRCHGDAHEAPQDEGQHQHEVKAATHGSMIRGAGECRPDVDQGSLRPRDKHANRLAQSQRTM